MTAVCILEGFQNQATLQMADRVLKNLGKQKAKEALKVHINTEHEKNTFPTVVPSS